MAVIVVIRSPSGAAADPSAPPLSLTFDAPRIVLGRGESCEVRLPDPSVSLRHASLRQHGGSYLLIDEGSTNGTFVGDLRLAPQAPRVIASGDRVRLGRVWVEVHVDAASVPSPAQATKELALALVQRALESLGETNEARLVVQGGVDQGKTLSLLLASHPYVIGRGQGADLMLDEPDASRQHVQVIRKGEQVYVRDLGSKNGSYFENKRMVVAKDKLWPPAAVLRIGKDTIVYENAAALALAELEHCADEQIDPQEFLSSRGEPALSGFSFSELDQNPAIALGSAHRSTESASFSEATPLPPNLSPELSRKSSAPKIAKNKNGWGIGDMVILVVAVLVLGLSMAGLWLLFHASHM